MRIWKHRLQEDNDLRADYQWEKAEFRYVYRKTKIWNFETTVANCIFLLFIATATAILKRFFTVYTENRARRYKEIKQGKRPWVVSFKWMFKFGNDNGFWVTFLAQKDINCSIEIGKRTGELKELKMKNYFSESLSKSRWLLLYFTRYFAIMLDFALFSYSWRYRYLHAANLNLRCWLKRKK